MRLGTQRSSEWSDAACAIMWVDGRDSERLRRWLPVYMCLKGNAIRDKVRNIDHRLYSGCVVVVKKSGSLEVV